MLGLAVLFMMSDYADWQFTNMVSQQDIKHLESEAHTFVRTLSSNACAQPCVGCPM